MYPQFFMPHKPTQNLPNKVRLLDPDQDYIISYVSLEHLNHAILCISKKIDDQFYIINTVGVMQAENTLTPFDDDYRVIHELIRPGRNYAYVRAKHYPANEETANKTLTFIEAQRNTQLAFSRFSKNCHNLAVAILESVGIYDDKLNSSTFPHDSSCNRCELDFVDVPEEILTAHNFELFQFYNAQGKTRNKIYIDNIKTWCWGSIKLEDKLVYHPKEEYYYSIKEAMKFEDEAPDKLTQALYLLNEYANGSCLLHPDRHYRNLVSEITVKYEYDTKTVNELLDEIRAAVMDFHVEHGDVPSAKGSLFQRLAFIDFVLNEPDELYSPQLNINQTK